ncbi:MAG: dihydroneopterin aldolase [Ignavibacteriales bacterium]|nr:dihydroneopterin aldolase [Ignavibacteriales bacterium]
MENIIRIKNASFYAYHGAMQEEQSIGGKFEADIDIYTDFLEAAKYDDLHKTINYYNVYKIMNKVVHEKKYNLIETIALEVTDKILENFPTIKKIAVRIRKNNVPVGGVIECVEAEIIKENAR